MSQFRAKLNPFTGQLQLVPTNIVLAFKSGVATHNDLPLTGNAMGDARIANDTGNLWVWSLEASSGLLTDWTDAGDIVDIDWSVITNKPSSSVANIDDAVTKRHTQNTDQYLDFGGVNQKAVADIQVKKEGGTFYVDYTSGNDSNPGTIDLPFKTIKAVTDLYKNCLLNSSVSIKLRAGTHVVDSSISITGVYGKKGITVSRYASEDVLITGNVKLFDIDYNQSKIKIENLKFRVEGDNLICIEFVDNEMVEVNTCSFGDNGNTGTKGIAATNSLVMLRACSDLDASKVTYGISCSTSHGSGIPIFFCDEYCNFGDTLVHNDNNGKIFKGRLTINAESSGLTISATDYNDAISKKHTQGTDQKLDDGGINEVTAAQVKSAVTDDHTHSNKATLDAIQEALTTVLKTAYDGAVTDSHSHSNKLTLDAIEQALTTALKSAYDDAVSKAHTQNTDYILVLNSSGLPALIEDGELKENLLVTALKTIDGRDLSVDGSKLDGIEAGAIALATVKADGDISSAISLKHSHTNQATLDLIQEALTTILKTAYDGAVTHAGLTSGNPHQVTKTNIGLGNVTNDAQVKSSQLIRGTFVNGDLVAGILTITHNLALSAPYVVNVIIFDNNNKMIIPDDVTGATNTTLIDLTTYGVLTGTWGYLLLG